MQKSQVILPPEVPLAKGPKDCNFYILHSVLTVDLTVVTSAFYDANNVKNQDYQQRLHADFSLKYFIPSDQVSYS